MRKVPLGRWSWPALALVALAGCVSHGRPTQSLEPPKAARAAPQRGANAPPSDASIMNLLELMDARALIDALKAQVDATVATSMQQAMQGKPMTPAVRAVLDRMQARMQNVAAEMLNWDALQAIYVRTYRSSFTQGEVDSIIKFYQTSGGQALVRKMPLVMQNVMTQTQLLTGPMQAQIQQIQQETLAELQALPPQRDDRRARP